MKKIVLATALLVAFSISSFANEDKSYKKLYNDLIVAFTSASNAQPTIKWSTTDNYRKAAFVFKGESVSAYFDIENDDLIGFGHPLAADDLPVEALANIQKKYEGWTLGAATMFLYGDGRINYYVNANKGKKSIILAITRRGQVSMFSKMPSR